MVSTRTLAVCLLCALFFSVAAVASPVVTAYTALAPNGFGSPSFPSWQVNAIAALYSGSSTAGGAGSPDYFSMAPSQTVRADTVVVTGFPSWQGVVNPGVNVGPAFASEYGNRMHFPVQILGNGSKIKISDLSLSGVSTDTFAALNFGFTGYTYSSAYVGIDYGPDGIRGTLDDVIVNSGPATTLVDEIIGRGSGNSFAAYCPGCTLAQMQQAILDVSYYDWPNPFTFTGTWTLDDPGGAVSGSATYTIVPTPEPGSWLLLSAGLALIGWRKLRR